MLALSDGTKPLTDYIDKDGIDELAPDMKPVRCTAFVALLFWFGW